MPPKEAIRTATAYQLKITLRNVKPPVWRRVLVPDCTLDDLHAIIQIAMGWGNCHLYCFTVGASEFTRPDMDAGELNTEDSRKTMLGDLIASAGQKLSYTYDFGNDWIHQIVVEKIEPAEAGRQLPACLKGRGACPPEDVGGPWGYAEYLKAINDPQHRRHQEFMDWGGPFDPESFQLDAVNRRLRGVLG